MNPTFVNTSKTCMLSIIRGWFQQVIKDERFVYLVSIYDSFERLKMVELFLIITTTLIII